MGKTGTIRKGLLRMLPLVGLGLAALGAQAQTGGIQTGGIQTGGIQTGGIQTGTVAPGTVGPGTVGPGTVAPGTVGPGTVPQIGVGPAPAPAGSPTGGAASRVGPGGSGGGTLLTFGLNQRFEVAENLSLDTPSEGTTAQATTRLSFAAVTETRASRLAFNLSGTIRAADSPDADIAGLTFDGPQARLRYTRTAASARFDLSATYARSEIAFLRPLEDFLDEDGVIVVPDDLDGLSGSGARTSYGVTARLDLRTDAPLGFGLEAGISGISYGDATSAALTDTRRQSVAASARLRLSPVTNATVQLRYATFEEVDGPDPVRDTLSLTAGLSRAFKDGALTADLTGTRTEEGERLGFTLGRSYQLKTGSVSGSLGVTRSENGETNLTGGLTYGRDFKRGRLSAQLRRSVVSSGTDDTTRVITLATLDYNQSLTPLSSIGARLSFGQSEDTTSGGGTEDLTLSATYTRALTEDWGLDLGLTHRTREDADGRASSNALFLGLRRDFQVRF